MGKRRMFALLLAVVVYAESLNCGGLIRLDRVWERDMQRYTANTSAHDSLRCYVSQWVGGRPGGPYWETRCVTPDEFGRWLNVTDGVGCEHSVRTTWPPRRASR